MNTATTDIVIIDNRDLLVSVFSELIEALVPDCELVVYRSLEQYLQSNRDAKVYLVNIEFFVLEDTQRPSFDLNLFCENSTVLLTGNTRELNVPSGILKLDIHSPGPNVVDVIRGALHAQGLLAANRVPQVDRGMEVRAPSKPALGLGGRGLTPKQVKILEFASQGLSSQEIADMLGVTVNTIRGHTQEIFVRLNVKNIAHAVAVYTKAHSIDRFNLKDGERLVTWSQNEEHKIKN